MKRCGTGSLGDGLGPAAVWDDCVSAGQNVTIATGGGSARATPSSAMKYALLAETGPHSWVEMIVRQDLDANADGINDANPEYNVQVHARMEASFSNGKSYLVKVLDNDRGCVEPTLFVVRTDEGNDIGCVTEDASHSRPNDALVAKGAAFECASPPPLNLEDGTSNRSQPALVRAEVLNEGINPRVIGTVAWGDCLVTGDLSTCQDKCQLNRLDSGDEGQMFDIEGSWGASFHKKHYFIDVFRAGSNDE